MMLIQTGSSQLTSLLEEVLPGARLMSKRDSGLEEEMIEEKFDRFKETIKSDMMTHRLILVHELSEEEIEETLGEALEAKEVVLEETEVDSEEVTSIETDKTEVNSTEETLTEKIEATLIEVILIEMIETTSEEVSEAETEEDFEEAIGEDSEEEAEAVSETMIVLEILEEETIVQIESL